MGRNTTNQWSLRDRAPSMGAFTICVLHTKVETHMNHSPVMTMLCRLPQAMLAAATADADPEADAEASVAANATADLSQVVPLS